VSQDAFAYDNRPLPSGEGQTISQPFVVAPMTDLLDPKAGDGRPVRLDHRRRGAGRAAEAADRPAQARRADGDPRGRGR
jgi:hypothetical protein